MTESAAGRIAGDEDVKGLWASGLATFAGVLLITLGFLQILQGLTAVAQDALYVSTVSYVFRFDLTVWGWIHLIVGAAAIAVGVLIMTGRLAGFVVGILIAAISAVSNFLFIPYYPFWSLVLIALDVAVIWALSVLTGRRSA